MRIVKWVLVLLILTVIGTIGYVVYKSTVDNRDTMAIVEDLQEEMKLKSRFNFNPPKVKNKTEIVTPDKDFKTVPLYLQNGYAYDVRIPLDMQVVTDYATYIYAVDSTMSVHIVDGVKPEQLEAVTMGYDMVRESNSLIKSEVGKKVPQEFAYQLFDDTALVVCCYDRPDAYVTLLSGITNESMYDVAPYNAYIDDKQTTVLTSSAQLQVDTSLISEVFEPSLSNSAGVNMSFYDDGGELVEIVAMKGFDETKDELLIRAGLANRQSKVLDLVYTTKNNGMYAQCGNVTFLIIPDTYNRTFAFLGFGNEAREQIKFYVKSKL